MPEHTNSPPKYIAPFESALRTFLLQASPTPIEDVATTQPHNRQYKLGLEASLSESKLLLSQVSAFIEDLTQVRQAHERRVACIHNTLHAPLLALPPELVGEIFEYVMNTTYLFPWDYPGPVRQAFSLTHICSHWRMVAISWHGLWNRIVLGTKKHPQIQDMWMERSSNGLVDVWVYNDPGPSIHQLKPRIRHLYLYGVETIDNGGSFDRLEALNLDFYRTGDFSSWNTPVLRQLSLRECDVGGGDLVFPDSLQYTIRSLCIDAPLSTYWVCLLASFKQLDKLYLVECDYASQDRDVKVMGRMSQGLGTLSHFYLTRVQGTMIISFLPTLSWPNLKSALLGPIYNDLDGDIQAIGRAITEFLGRASGLQSIILDCHVDYFTDSSPLFNLLTHRIRENSHFLPCLQNLYICGSDPAEEKNTFMLNTSRLAQALHERRTNATNPSPYPRLFISDDGILESEQKWHETMDYQAEQNILAEYGPMEWTLM